MVSMKRLVVLVLLLGYSLFGQRNNTVYYSVATNATSDIFVELPPSANIGQPFHLAYATFSDAPGKTCTQPSTDVSNIPNLQLVGGSSEVINNYITNYARVINPSTTSATDRYRMAATAAGSFPKIWVELDGWDTTNCIANVFYSGSTGSLDIKKYVDFGSAIDTAQSESFTYNTSGDHALVPQVCASCRITLYGIVLFNQTAQQLQLVDHRADTTTTTLLQLDNYCTGCQLNLPNTNYPLLTTTMGGSLYLHLQNATFVSGFILYRIE